MKYIYLLCLFLVVSCSNQNQLAYFCNGSGRDYFDFFIELNLNSDNGTITRTLTEYGFRQKQQIGGALDTQDMRDEYGDDYVDNALKVFDEKEEVVYIRSITEGFVSFSTLKEKGRPLDVLYTFNRANLELRKVNSYDDEFYSSIEDITTVDKETIDYFDCEAPKV